MKQVTFLHSADLHLDSPMTGLSHLPKNLFERMKESTFTALKTLTDAAIRQRVDFVILAGDLFDEEDRSVRAQTRLRKEMLRLYEQGIEVYIVYGNHDHLHGSWIHLEMPENVHIFHDQVEMKVFQKGETTVHLYGFSYPERHVTENMSPYYAKVDGADFHIGILHGHSDGVSEHGRYAPFQVKELVAKGFDYWALGHIHQRQLLHEEPYIVYPGNIQGRNRKEKGKKGCYLVTLTEERAKLEFIETFDILWEESVIDARELQSFQDLYLRCLQEVETKRLFNKGVLLHLTLKNISLSPQERKAVMNGELLEALQEEEREEEGFVWTADLQVEEEASWQRQQLEAESDFFRELFRLHDKEEHVTESIGQLYEHPTARKFLPELTDDERKELQEEALHTLVQILQRD